MLNSESDRRGIIGTAALLERLSAWTIGLGILHLLGAGKIHGGYRIPWENLDLTDPEHPRLRCTLQEFILLSRE